MFEYVYKDKATAEYLLTLKLNGIRPIVIGEYTEEEKQKFYSIGVFDIATTEEEAERLKDEPTTYDRIKIDNSDKTEEKVIIQDVNIAKPKAYKKPIKMVILILAILAILSGALFGFSTQTLVGAGIYNGIAEKLKKATQNEEGNSPFDFLVEVDTSKFEKKDNASTTPPASSNDNSPSGDLNPDNYYTDETLPEDVNDFDKDKVIIRDSIYGKWKFVRSFATKEMLEATYRNAYGDEVDENVMNEWIEQHIHDETFAGDSYDYFYYKEGGRYLQLFSLNGCSTTRSIIDDEKVMELFGGYNGEDFMRVQLGMKIVDNQLLIYTPMCVLVYEPSAEFTDRNIVGDWEWTHVSDKEEDVDIEEGHYIHFSEDEKFSEDGFNFGVDIYYVVDENNALIIYTPTKDAIMGYQYFVEGDTLTLVSENATLTYKR